jgi:hypothetical protein
MVLAAHESVDKTGRQIKTEYVLSVSNWHFVRDNQNVKVLPACEPKDCVISLKLSSTAFQAATPFLQHDQRYFYDKNGLLVPYVLFLHLMSLSEFTTDLMDAPRREYESRGNQLQDDDNEAAVDDLLSLETADQEAEELARRADEDAYIKRLESGDPTLSSPSVMQEEVQHQSQGPSPRLPHFYLPPDVEIQSESEDVVAPQTKSANYQRENDNGDADAGDDDNDDGKNNVKKKSRRHYPSPRKQKISCKQQAQRMNQRRPAANDPSLSTSDYGCSLILGG